MNSIFDQFKLEIINGYRFFITSMMIGILTFIFYGCGGDRTESDTEDEASVETYSGVVEVVTNALDLVMRDTIPSGWTTFRYENKSNMTHFFILERMPEHNGEQLTVENTIEEVVPVFQAIMDSINSGGEPPFDQLPEWFQNVEFLGGSGLIGPGLTSQTTFYVEPGTYTVECYVKNPGGIFHSNVGMITGLIVTEDSTEFTPPVADINISLSSEGGIEAPEEIEPGVHTVAVNFEDQKVQENFVGVDLHLAQLPDTTIRPQLEAWMNWMAPEGLQVQAPVTFLGGTQEMPAGSTTYFEVELEPGRYAWVSEVPDPALKKMLWVFVVN